MPLSPQELGKRLRDARGNCSISQQAAAEHLGVPRTAITQLENGKRSVSTLELANLAELYRRSINEFFVEDTDEVAPDAEEDLLVLPRVLAGLEDHPAVQERVSHCMDICQEGYDLETMLGLKGRNGPPSYGVRAPENPFHAINQAAQVASEERRRLDLGNAPIADMADLIVGQGIWASGASLPDEMSGLFLKHSSIGMAIIVNYDHPRARKRFSYAHEYGHALMDRDRTASTSTSDNASELIEKRANAFAAAFLMPEDGIEEALEAIGKGRGSRQEAVVYDVANDASIDAQSRSTPGSQMITYQDVAMLSHHFGASYQAVVYRLRSLKCILRERADILLDQVDEGHRYLELLQMLDDIEKPDDTCDREIKSQVVYLAAEAYRREEISKGRLLDISKKLGFSGRDLIKLAEAAKKD